ncbi:MAG TPA: serine hydrolase domain-containing protein [Pirellulales bacterium]|jgi:N-acyl-D-amino-acid deacylase
MPFKLDWLRAHSLRKSLTFKIAAVVPLLLGFLQANLSLQPLMAQVRTQPGAVSMPVTGEILPGSEALGRLDKVMEQILLRHEVPGAGVAITHDGKLLVARGYGLADVEARQPVEPTTLFALASVSKPITAITALKLVEDDRLALDQRALAMLGELKAPPGHALDPRLRTITLRMLLEHAGGWDRKTSGDPCTFGSRVHDELKVPLPVTIDQLIYYMNGQPLDFTPGTKQVYSNYGFAIAGRMVAQATGEPYVASVEKITLEPMGIHGIKMTEPREPNKEAKYFPNEAHRYFAGTTKSLPAGHNIVAAAAGGWCGSPVALARFLTAIDGTRTGKPFLSAKLMAEMLAQPEPPLAVRKNGSWFGLGWDSVREIPNWPHHAEVFAEGRKQKRGVGSEGREKSETAQRRAEIDELAWGKDGGLPGVSTWIEHLPGGIDWVVLFNGSKRQSVAGEKTITAEDEEHPSEAPQGNALQDARKEVVELLRDVKQWPEGDLFEKYR